MRRCSFLLLLLLITGSFTFLPSRLHAQQKLQKTFTYGLELQGAGSTGQYLPFWLYANRHGKVDPNAPGSSAILNFHKHINNHDSGFDYGFGATLVGRYSEDETLFFNRLYLSFSYGAFAIKGGRFYEQLGTVDPDLSMGSLAISQNATPIPKVKIGIPRYTDVPLTHGYVEVKGEIAHGWFEHDRYIHNPWLHQKSAYLRFGGGLPFRPYVGLTDQATWGGENDQVGDLADSFSDFLHVFTARSGNGDPQLGENYYKLGDHRGIWDFGFYLTLKGIHFTGYRQYIYNDKDGLKLQNPDALTGLSIRLPNKHQQIVSGLVYEYLYTKKQSGPLAPFGRDSTGGRDNYYNNYLYQTGWTYEGRTIGNPLFLNAYNSQLDMVANYLKSDRRFGIANNRIVAHHVGIMGRLSNLISYRLMGTYSRNYGNYYDQDLFEETGRKSDFYNHPDQWSFFAKFGYRPFDTLKINLSLAGDVGKLYEDRLGVMVGLKLFSSSSF